MRLRSRFSLRSDAPNSQQANRDSTELGPAPAPATAPELTSALTRNVHGTSATAASSASSLSTPLGPPSAASAELSSTGSLAASDLVSAISDAVDGTRRVSPV